MSEQIEKRYLWAPEHQFLYESGEILAGGSVKVYKYETTELATLYNTENVEIPNPVVLDANGRGIAIATTDYDYILEVRDIDENLLYTAIAYLHTGSGVVDIISSNHSIGITKSSSNVYDIQIKAGDYVYLNGNEINVRAKKIIADAPIYLNKVDNDFHIGIDGSSVLSGISAGVNTTYQNGIIDVTNYESTANKDMLCLAFGSQNYAGGTIDVLFGDTNSSYGGHSLTQGHENADFGEFNTINGSQNNIAGTFNIVNGTEINIVSTGDNTVYFNIVNGSNNTVSSQFTNLNGWQNNIKGGFLTVNGGQNIFDTITYGITIGDTNSADNSTYINEFGHANNITSSVYCTTIGNNNMIKGGYCTTLIGHDLKSPDVSHYNFFAIGNNNYPRNGDLLEVSNGNNNILSVRNDGHVFLNNPISSTTPSGIVDITKNYFSPFESMFGEIQWAYSTQHNHYRKTLYKAASNTDADNWVNIIPTDSDETYSAGIPMYRTTDRGLYKLTINATVKGGYSINSRNPEIVTIQPQFSYTGCSNYMDLYQGFPKDTGSSANTPLNHYTMEWYLWNTGYGNVDDMIKMTSLQFYAYNTRWNATQSTQSAIVNIDLVKIKDWNEVQ